MLAFLNFLWWMPLAGSVAAVVACAVRRWSIAVALSRAALLASPIVLGLHVARFAASTFTPVDPSFRATLYAAGIAELISCGALPVLAALLSAATWRVARRRVLRPEPRDSRP